MISHTEKCIDPRGEEHLKTVFADITEVMGCADAQEAAGKFTELLKVLDLQIPTAKTGDFEKLKNSVNLVRLKNNPVALDAETIDDLYHQILKAE